MYVCIHVHVHTHIHRLHRLRLFIAHELKNVFGKLQNGKLFGTWDIWINNKYCNIPVCVPSSMWFSGSIQDSLVIYLDQMTQRTRN